MKETQLFNEFISEVCQNDYEYALAVLYGWIIEINQMKDAEDPIEECEEFKVGDQVFKTTGCPLGKKGYTITKIEGTKATIVDWLDTESEIIDLNDLEH